MEYTQLEVAKILNVSKAVIKYRSSLLPEGERIKRGEQWYITEPGLQHLRTILKIPNQQDHNNESEHVYIDLDPIIVEPREVPETQERPEPKKTGTEQNQPDQKDELIKVLQEENKNLTRLLDQQQQLHSKDISHYQNLLSLNSGETEQLERSDKAKTIIIIVLVLALIGFGAYFIWYIS